MLRLNVYGFTVYRQSQLDAGSQSGDLLAVIAATVDAARAAARAFIGDDLANASGPTIIVANALYDDEAADAAPTSPPVNVDVPLVSGTGTVGSTLNCTMGNWTGEPTSYAYQWKRDGLTNIGTSASYTVLSTDLGRSITCVVTATNAAGSTAAPPSNAVMGA